MNYPFSAGPIPLRVREAELPIVSDAECIRKVNAVTEKIFILPASSFCAGGEEGNDACQVFFILCYLLNVYFRQVPTRVSNPHSRKSLLARVILHLFN